MANQLQSMGRGEDSMLIHMTPGEVNSLQGLAMAHGGSLTINPQTGLPEAGWLGKLLPTILGAALAATGVGAPAAALMVGAGQTALTGSLQKGLMAGLGAFGGAGLAGAAGVGGSLLGGNAGGLLGESAGLFGANMGLGAAAPAASGAVTAAAAPAVGTGAPLAGTEALLKAPEFAATAAAEQAAAAAAPNVLAPAAVPTALPGGGAQFTGGLLDKFGQATRQGLGGAPKILAKNAPMLAGLGALGSVSDAMQPKMPTYDEEDDYKFEYKGPYVPGKREVSFQSDEDMRSSGGAEGTFFTPSNPPPRLLSDLTPEERIQYGYAEGGTAKLPASDDFKALVDYFNSSSPGAVTASMQPTTPKQIDTGEIVNKFDRKPSAPNIMGGGAAGGAGGGYNFDLSGLSGLDINGLLNQYGYTQNTPIPGKDVAPVINNPAVASPGNIPGFSAPDIMDFGLQGRDQFEPGYRPEMLNIQSPEDMYPKYSAPAMQDFQYTPPSMQDFQYTPPAMQDFQQYAPPSMQDSVYNYGQGMMPVDDSYRRYERSYDTLDEFARGGEVNMRDGSFVVDARTVSELGNGSSNAGMELLARMGGRPLQGPGDGVSDSIRARIGGKQEARVARDEVLFSPEAVKRLGKGSDKRGTTKLYALMNKAHKARKNAKRGQDTKVRKGLA
jgi:hypothetical protein